MLGKFFVTTFSVLLIWVFLKTKAEPKKDLNNFEKFLWCLIFVMIQSIFIACMIMIIYNIWR